MKAFIVLTVFVLIIFCIKGTYSTLDIQSKFYSEVPELLRRYCGLSVENRKKFRFCLRENGDEVSSEFYRNCAQQLKFGHTFEEFDKFVCQPETKLESLFLKCFIPALGTLNLNNPETYPVIRKCLSNEENDGFHAKVHIKEEYQY